MILGDVAMKDDIADEPAHDHVNLIRQYPVHDGQFSEHKTEKAAFPPNSAARIIINTTPK